MKAYQKGRRKEYKIVNHLKSLGMVAFRSAGSHSPIDVIAIDPHLKIIKLVQSKAYAMSSNAISKLVEDNKGFNGTFEVTFEVV